MLSWINKNYFQPGTMLNNNDNMFLPVVIKGNMYAIMEYTIICFPSEKGSTAKRKNSLPLGVNSYILM